MEFIEEASTTKYWLYQPGKKAFFWSDFLEKDIIALGWDHLSDLSVYISKIQIQEKLRELDAKDSTRKNDATANWDFVQSMQVGDIIIVKKGRRKLLGYGEVVSDYYFDADRKEYKSVRRMNWLKSGEWEVGFDLVLKTLTDITRYDSKIVKDQKYYDYLLSIMNEEVGYKEDFRSWLSAKTMETSNKVGSYVQSLVILSERIAKNIFEVSDLEYLEKLYQDLVLNQKKEDGKYYYEKSPSYGKNGYYSAAIKEYITFHKELLHTQNPLIMPTSPLPPNQILYGPPGTGKTYHTINKAISIANPDFDLHQSRDLVKEEYQRLVEAGQIVFTTFHQSMSYEDFVEGIKPLKPLPTDTFVKYEVQTGIFRNICKEAETSIIQNLSINKSKLPFAEVFEKLKLEWEEDNNLKFPLKTAGYDYTILGFTNTSIQFKKASGGTGHTLSIKTLEDLYYGKQYDFSSGVGIYYPAILSKLESYNDSSKIESSSRVDKVDNYVLIIDEINRGNVSAIFGELITLIEDSKRAGMPEQLEAMLPYSKEKFSVPSNLYIIGTMNTADRSVEALDSALRRRFVFEEMLPNYQLPEMQKHLFGYPASSILEKINQRIELLIDRDHCIGHAYFLGKDEETIIDSFYKNIIPLLQEYFFGDYGKIGLVLGEGFVEISKNENVVFADFTYDYKEDLASKPIYRIRDYQNDYNRRDKFGEAIALLMGHG